MRNDQLNETVFTWGAPPLKLGTGAPADVGHEVAATGAASCLLIIYPGPSTTICVIDFLGRTSRPGVLPDAARL